MCVSLNKAREFVEKGEFTKALELFLQTLPILDKNSLECASAISEIGSLYFGLKDVKNAEIYDTKFYEICSLGFKNKPEIWKNELTDSLVNLAFLNLAKSEFDKAIEFINKALEISMDESLIIQKIEILKNISNKLFQNGNIKEALKVNENLLAFIDKDESEILANQLFFNAVLLYILKDDRYKDSLNKSIKISTNLKIPTTKQEKFIAKISL